MWTVDLGASDWASGTCAVTRVRRLDFFSEFLDVNPRGEAVGEDLVSHEPILFLAESGVLLYLPPLTRGGTVNEARAINADGSRVVGLGTGAKSATRAVLWTRLQ